MRHEIELFSRKLDVRDPSRGCSTMDWVFGVGINQFKGLPAAEMGFVSVTLCVSPQVSATSALMFICELRALGGVGS